MEKKEFSIKSRDKLKFRCKDVNAVDFLAARIYIDFDDADKIKKLYNWVLSVIEVNIGGEWVTVKQGEEYFPLDLKEDIIAIKEIVDYYLNEVYLPVFTKSKE